LDRSRIIGAAMRVAYIISASMADILPRTPMKSVHGRRLVLTLPYDLRDLANERLQNRLKQLARLVGDEPEIKIA
jgi:exopolyphosphatase / guanosine-5'-triphosphate,3'-diphosphate pyrophosphatase